MAKPRNFNNTSDTEELKQHLSDYLREKGIDTTRPFLCLNPDHDDHSPSMSFYRDKNIVHCFSCGKNYDLFDLIGIDYNLPDFSQRADKARELYGRGDTPRNIPPAKKVQPQERKTAEPTVLQETIEQAQKHLTETDYYTRRGLSLETVQHFHCGFIPNWKTPLSDNAPESPRFIIPTSDCTYIARDTRAQLTDVQRKYSKMKGGHAELFNLACLENEKAVFVCEGEIDAMTFYQAGLPAVGLGSTSMIDRFIAHLQEHPVKVTIVPCLDNDEAGRKATPDFIAKLREIGADVYEIPSELDFTDRTQDNPPEGKDPNDWYLNNKTAFIQKGVEILKQAYNTEALRLQEEQERREQEKADYNRKYSVSCLLQGFNEYIEQTKKDPVFSTGFYQLDQKLDGGFKPEQLVVLGAVPSLGKTALAMQVIEHMAQCGNDVMIFNFEMSTHELIARSLSRHTAVIAREEADDINVCLSQNWIQEGRRHALWTEEQKTAYEMAVKNYGEYAPHVYMFEAYGKTTAQDIQNSVEKHVRTTGNRPVVLIDYLQMIKPSDPHLSEKQTTDEAVLFLKQTARRFRVPVILISSLNRDNYNEKISMKAFKESGGIEYTADVAIGLQYKGAGEKSFDSKEASGRNPRDVELHVLKSRRSAVGEVVNFKFYPRNFLFVEA